MSTYAPLLILTLLLHIPFLTAEVVRAQPLFPTLAPLYVRQAATCAIGQTACHDSSGGCCDYGALCTVNTNNIPVCLEQCNGGPTCTGIMNGLCCNIGFTCDYQSTSCVSNSPGFGVVTLTGSNDGSGPASVAAPSITGAVTSPTTSLPIPSVAVPSPVSPIAPVVSATCAIGQTACLDGGGGCCDYGALCTVNTNNIPVCLEQCNGGPTCTGIMNGLCCNIGFTCDYQSTSCVSNSPGFGVVTLTGSNDGSGPASVAAPSITEAVTSPTTSLPIPSVAVPSPVSPIAPVVSATSLQDPGLSSSTDSTTRASSMTGGLTATEAIGAEPSTPTTSKEKPSAAEPTGQPSSSALTLASEQGRLSFGVEQLLVSCALMLLFEL